ncbi:MAG: hypothetical protein NVV82_10165 [Sporocytophaga sp.]|nr:hypothetical protein [Sporocytophaga sp.]
MYLKKKEGRYFTYYSSESAFAGLTYINRRFYKDRYIFRLGRTEDIPIGKMMGITAGVKKKGRTTSALWRDKFYNG